MDVLTLILACSLYPNAAVQLALAHTLSLDNPHFVGSAASSDQEPYDHLADTDAAVAKVQELQAAGRRAVAGLFAVPVALAEDQGAPVAALFDSCTNTALASAQLVTFAAECERIYDGSARRPRRARRPRQPREVFVARCAIHHYGALLGAPGLLAETWPALPDAQAKIEAHVSAHPLQLDMMPPGPSSAQPPPPADAGAKQLSPAVRWSVPRPFAAPNSGQPQ